MVHERGAPGVQHRRDADLGTEVFRIRRDREQGLGDDLEHEVIDDLLVLVSERAQRLGQGEHDVEVGDRQQILALSIEPALGG